MDRPTDLVTLVTGTKEIGDETEIETTGIIEETTR
jgi:hypothetical protein